MNIVLTEPLGINENYLLELSDFIKKDGHSFTYYNTKETDDELLLKRVENADIIMLANQKLSKYVLSNCKNLKMISTAFTGVDHIDTEYCKEKNIPILNASGYSTTAVSELTFGLIIDLYRKITEMDLITRESKTRNGFAGRELYGKTLGVIGTGQIGRRVVQIGKAFGCNVIAYNRTKHNDSDIKYVELNELMKESDIVTIHIPLTKETENLINEEKLILMKKNAVIINTARGKVIDNKALAKLLKEGKIAGAAIDVFETEPPIESNHPLFDAPNTVLTPHIGFATKEALNVRAAMAFDNIKSFLKTETE